MSHIRLGDPDEQSDDVDSTDAPSGGTEESVKKAKIMLTEEVGRFATKFQSVVSKIDKTRKGTVSAPFLLEIEVMKTEFMRYQTLVDSTGIHVRVVCSADQLTQILPT